MNIKNKLFLKLKKLPRPVKKILLFIFYTFIKFRGLYFCGLIGTITMFNICKNWRLHLWDAFGLTRLGYGVYIMRNGLKILFRKKTSDSDIVSEVFGFQIYNNKILKDSKIIIDLGGHIGCFTLFAANFFPQSRIITVEAVPENFCLLKTNIEFNCLSDRVTLYNKAIWSHTHGINININKNNSGGHSAVQSFKNNLFINIKSITLEAIFQKNNLKFCDLLKLDIEGAEYEVIYKTDKIILKAIKNMVFEVHNIDEHKNNCGHLQTYLCELGFNTFIVKGKLKDSLWAQNFNFIPLI